MSLEPRKACSLLYVLANICRVPSLEGHVSVGNVGTSFALGMQGVPRVFAQSQILFCISWFKFDGKESESKTMACVSNTEPLGQIHREVTSSVNFKASWRSVYPDFAILAIQVPQFGSYVLTCHAGHNNRNWEQFLPMVRNHKTSICKCNHGRVHCQKRHHCIYRPLMEHVGESH